MSQLRCYAETVAYGGARLIPSKRKAAEAALSPNPPCCLDARLGRGSVAVSAMRGLLGFFSTSSKPSPVDGGRQRYVAVCVRERELGQLIALNRMPVAVGCCFYGDGCVHDSASLLLPRLVHSNQSAT